MEKYLDKLRFVKDWPKVGVSFIDITSLTTLPEFADDFIEFVEDFVSPLDLDYVIGLESRGLIGASWLSKSLRVPMLMARKAGKLPPPVASSTLFRTEYSTDQFEISLSYPISGKTFHIHDDVLATGGSYETVKNLIESRGGIVKSASFLVEIESLSGRSKVQPVLCVSAIKI